MYYANVNIDLFVWFVKFVVDSFWLCGHILDVCVVGWMCFE